MTEDKMTDEKRGSNRNYLQMRNWKKLRADIS